MLHTQLVTLALALALPSSSPSVGSMPNFDRSGFDSLTPERKLQFVVAALTWREEQLKNFHYKGEEVVSSGNTIVSRTEIDVRRLGQQSWIHGNRVQLLSGAELNEYWSQWDGKVQRTYAVQGAKKTGLIVDQETPHIASTYYHDLLGTRVELYNKDVPGWIRAYSKNHPYRIKTTGKD